MSFNQKTLENMTTKKLKLSEKAEFLILTDSFSKGFLTYREFMRICRIVDEQMYEKAYFLEGCNNGP